MKTVVFVNGLPRSGKDSAVARMRHGLMFPHGVKTHELSSIEPVRTLLRDNGFNVDRKTGAERDLLAEVGHSLEKYNGFRSSKCAEFIWKALDKDDGVVFIYVREPWMIQKIGLIAKDLIPNIVVKTLFVEGRGERITTNSADANVGDMNYDIRLLNDGSLEDLTLRCELIASELVQGGTHERTQPRRPAEEARPS